MKPLPRRTGGRVTIATAVLAVSSALVVASCADPKENSLCTRFEQLVASGEAIRADVDGETAGELSDQVDAVLQQVTALQEHADGRYTAELDALEETLDNLVRTLASIQEDAEYDTWAPLVDDSIEDLDNASARVAEAIAPSCLPAVTDVTTTT